MKISILEASEFLECGEERILDLLREGVLPGVKLGRAWVIPSAPFYAAVERLAETEAALLRQSIKPTPVTDRPKLGRRPLPRSVFP